MLKCNTQNAMRKQKRHMEIIYADDVADRAIKTKTYQVLTYCIQHKMGQTGRYIFNKCRLSEK